MAFNACHQQVPRFYISVLLIRCTFLLPAVAKAFALLSEEGIAKGIRRVVAVTAAEAQEAIGAGELLTERIALAGELPPLQLDKELGSLKQVSILAGIARFLTRLRKKIEESASEMGEA